MSIKSKFKSSKWWFKVSTTSHPACKLQKYWLPIFLAKNEKLLSALYRFVTSLSISLLPLETNRPSVFRSIEQCEDMKHKASFLFYFICDFSCFVNCLVPTSRNQNVQVCTVAEGTKYQHEIKLVPKSCSKCKMLEAVESRWLRTQHPNRFLHLFSILENRVLLMYQHLLQTSSSLLCMGTRASFCCVLRWCKISNWDVLSRASYV